MSRLMLLGILLSLGALACAQDLASSFKEVELPLSGEKKHFGMKDLIFHSNPKLLDKEIIRVLDPSGEPEYKDSIYNMETGKLITVENSKLKYFGFYKVTSPKTYKFFIYSKSEKNDEYGYNIYLNIHDELNKLKETIRIYSSSDLYPFRNFKLTKDSLLVVDYLPIKNEEIINGKKKKNFTTNFEITNYSFDKKDLKFIKVKKSKKAGSASVSKYKDAEIYLIDDPVRQF